MTEHTKSFDIAVLIDSKGQYTHVLHEDVNYEMKPRHLHFKTSQKYVKGDINIIMDCCDVVQEIDTERYIKGFIKKSNDISNSFSNIEKIHLFRFKDTPFANIWHQYVAKQKQTKCHIVVLVNNLNQPKYMLYSSCVNFLAESIKFKSCHNYQNNDIKILNSFAIKMKTFQIHNKWNIAIKNKADMQFKNGILYNFVNEQVEHEFFNQSYDVALVTNTKNEMVALLSQVTYIRGENAIEFESDTKYKNGFYQKVKECGVLQKSLTNVSQYRPHSVPNVHKCLLFSIAETNIDKWIDFIEAATNIFYDVGIIINTQNKQIYFLNKVHVDATHNTINFGGCEPYKEKHQDLIYKFGAFIEGKPLHDLTIPKLANDGVNKLQTINFYRWDTNKKAERPPPQKNNLLNIEITAPERKTCAVGSNGKMRKKGKSMSALPPGAEDIHKEVRSAKFKKRTKKSKSIKVNKIKVKKESSLGKQFKKSGKKKKEGKGKRIRSRSAMPTGSDKVHKEVKREREANCKKKGHSKNKKARSSKKEKEVKIKSKKRVKRNKKSKSELPSVKSIKSIKSKSHDSKLNRNRKKNTNQNRIRGHGSRKSENSLILPEMNEDFSDEEKTEKKVNPKKKSIKKKKVKKKRNK